MRQCPLAEEDSHHHEPHLSFSSGSSLGVASQIQSFLYSCNFVFSKMPVLDVVVQIPAELSWDPSAGRRWCTSLKRKLYLTAQTHYI